MNSHMRYLVASSALALAACGQSSIEGEYASTGGSVGIFEMESMLVTQEEGGETYRVEFVGPEETLSYDQVTRDGAVLSIDDKGFIFTVTFDGAEAVVGDGEATFEKVTD